VCLIIQFTCVLEKMHCWIVRELRLPQSSALQSNTYSVSTDSVVVHVPKMAPVVKDVLNRQAYDKDKRDPDMLDVKIVQLSCMKTNRSMIVHCHCA